MWEYEGLKKSDIKKARTILKSSGIYTFLPADVPVWRPNDGKNRIRIVPGVSPKKENPEVLPPKYSLYGVAWLLWIHRGIGEERKMFLCQQRMLGKPCLICSEAIKTNDPDMKSSLRARRIVLAWIWDRTDAMKEQEGLKIGLLPPTLFDEILAQTEDPETGEIIDIFHPKHGRDVFFTREQGEGGYPKYSGIKISNKESAVPEEFANIIKPISELIIYPDNEELKAYLFGYVETDIPVKKLEEELNEELGEELVEEDELL